MLAIFYHSLTELIFFSFCFLFLQLTDVINYRINFDQKRKVGLPKSCFVNFGHFYFHLHLRLHDDKNDTVLYCHFT